MIKIVQRLIRHLIKLKKNLTPLIVSNSKTVKIQTLKTHQNQVSSWFDPSGKITQYKIEYVVKSPSLQSKTHVAVHYTKAIKISQNYKVPKQDKRLVVVKYLGFQKKLVTTLKTLFYCYL